ncbi:MAG: ubiquinol-cytochrome c reductase iron-sulfur subunit [Rubrobacteraceae bacterium]
MKEKISRERFIRLGSAVGVSVAGASVISACGGGSGSSGSASGSASSSAASSSASTSSASSSESTSSDASSSSASDVATQEASGGEQAIARESDVAPGSATKFEDSGNPAILVHLDSGEFAAYSAICTHQQCTVAYRGGQLACPCHGSIYDPANGAQVVSGPAPRPLPEIPVEVRGGEVFRA